MDVGLGCQWPTFLSMERENEANINKIKQASRHMFTRTCHSYTLTCWQSHPCTRAHTLTPTNTHAHTHSRARSHSSNPRDLFCSNYDSKEAMGVGCGWGTVAENSFFFVLNFLSDFYYTCRACSLLSASQQGVREVGGSHWGGRRWCHQTTVLCPCISELTSPPRQSSLYWVIGLTWEWTRRVKVARWYPAIGAMMVEFHVKLVRL